MARILWLCRLIEYPRPGFWCPALARVQGGSTGFFPASWTTTDSKRAQPWACGVAEVTPEQLAAIQAEGGIHVFTGETERYQQFRELPNQRRNALNTYLQQIGQSQATNTEVIEDILDRVVGSNEPVKNITSLLDELATEIGRQSA